MPRATFAQTVSSESGIGRPASGPAVHEAYGHAGVVVDFFSPMGVQEHRSVADSWFSPHPTHATRVELLESLIALYVWQRREVRPLDGQAWAERCC